jgi:hypothetical protein
MTENDRDLLSRFRAAKFAYDEADLIQRAASIAKHVGESLRQLQYLEDPELRAMADIARLEFGPELPPVNSIPEMVRQAENKLVAAIKEAECF